MSDQNTPPFQWTKASENVASELGREIYNLIAERSAESSLHPNVAMAGIATAAFFSMRACGIDVANGADVLARDVKRLNTVTHAGSAPN